MKWSEHVHRRLSRLFGWWGGVVGSHPWAGIGAGVVLVLATLPGLPGITLDKGFEIWIPRGTRGWSDSRRMADSFGNAAGSPNNGATSIIAVLEPSVAFPAGVLSADVLETLLEYDARVRTEPHSSEGLTFGDVCFRELPSSPCEVSSLLTFLGVETAEGARDTPAILEQVGRGLVPPSLISGVARDPSTGNVTGAAALLLQYTASTEEDELSRVKRWELGMVDTLYDMAAAVGALAGGDAVGVFVSTALLEEESARLVSQEVPLVGGTICIILVYLCVMLGGRPPVMSRVSLAVGGVLTIVLSLAMSFGLSRYSGVTMTILSPLIIFLLLGVGVDDAFLLTHFYSQARRQRPHATSSETLSTALSSAGYAITVTSVTTLIAFICASFVDFPAIAFFSLTGAYAVASLYVLQLTMFAGMVVLDDRRLQDGRYDCACCFSSASARARARAAPPASSSASSLPKARPPGDDDHDHDRSGGGGTKATTRLERGLAAFSRAVAPARHRAAILAAFVCLAALQGYSASGVSTSADLTRFFSPGSMVRLFYDELNDHFDGQPRSTSFTTGRLEYERASVREACAAYAESIVSSPLQSETLPELAGGRITNWVREYDAYLARANATPPADGDAAAFASSLAGFVADEPLQRGRLAVDDATGRLSAARFIVFVPWPSAPKSEHDLVRRLRHFSDSETRRQLNDTSGTSYVYSQRMPISDRDEQLPRIIIVNLALAAGGVLASVLVFVQPVSAAVIGLSVVLTSVSIVGSMRVLGSGLDVAAFSILSFSYGIAVDYVIHTTEYVAAMPVGIGLPERLRRMYVEMAPAVLNGGLSTFMGVCLLAFSQSPGFRNFFVILGSTVLFGTLHGLVFGPSLLAFVLPTKASGPTDGAAADAKDGGTATNETGQEMHDVKMH